VTPVVLVPGLLCSGEIFAYQVPALWPFGPVTVASTLHGAKITEVASAILSDAPPRFALAGFSLGGPIAFEIIRQAPDRVSKLALLDTSARPDSIRQTDARFQRLAQARTHFDAVAMLALTGLVHPLRRNDPRLLQIIRRMARAVGLDAYGRQHRIAISRPDSRPFLSTIRVPTLVLVGDCDPVTPPDHSLEIASAIDRARLKIVRNCGHLSPIERPRQVTQALLRWLRD